MKGLFLNLRKPEISDIDILTEWFQDPVFIENVFDLQDQDPKKKAFSLLNQNAKDTTQILTLIAENHQKEPIGLILYQNLNWKHRNIEMNNAIGHPKHRQSLYGADLYLLGLTYAFLTLNMHKVFGYTYHSNTSAKKLNQYAAKVSGILPEHIFNNGRYVDLVVFSILMRHFVDFLNQNEQGIIRKFVKCGMFNGLIE